MAESRTSKIRVCGRCGQQFRVIVYRVVTLSGSKEEASDKTWCLDCRMEQSEGKIGSYDLVDQMSQSSVTTRLRDAWAMSVSNR